MAIPIIYNVRSVRQRWVSAMVAVAGIAGTVAVFVAMLALAQGFKATLVASGSPENAIVRRAGASSEMESVVFLDQVRVLETAPGVRQDEHGPLVSAEVVVVAAFPLAATGTDANVQVRGTSLRAFAVRPSVRITEGRAFEPGLTELVVGSNAARAYAGFGLGSQVRFGGANWTVVGVFDAGGSAFDSEVWCDAKVLNHVFQRPHNFYQSLTIRLTGREALRELKDAATADPRLTVQVDREVEYYEKQSRQLTTLITVLGTLIAGVMGIGAVFAALNTMYSAVAQRVREIATIRALGFGGAAVVASFLVEALLIALAGGLLGCVLVLPLNGLTTGTMNWQTFSHLSFAFRVTPGLLAAGLVFSLLMGVIGGLPPALRAARLPIAAALREL